MITCRMTLKVNGEVVSIDWGWKENFDDFLREAIEKHPDVDRISLDWGGDETSMHQGDLLYGVWEKHDGKWYRVEMNFFIHHDLENTNELVLYPALNEEKWKT